MNNLNQKIFSTKMKQNKLKDEANELKPVQKSRVDEVINSKYLKLYQNNNGCHLSSPDTV